VIDQIAAQINGEFDPAHALIVRKNASGYEIISGHHRSLAAQKAGLTEVPCWVREMSDEDAYMALALCNAQGELSTLERAVHALNSNMGVREYAKATGASPTWITHLRQAAEVFTQVNSDPNLYDKTKQLIELHSAPRWLWKPLVERLVSEGWTVETARKEAQRLKDAQEPLPWVNRDAVSKKIASGELTPSNMGSRHESVHYAR